MGSLPDETQFYRFINKTPNSVFEKIHLEINRRLIDQGVVSLDTFIIDSKPVMAATKENNLKNPSRNSRNKNKKPKRNPAATLSYYSYQKISGQKNYIFFWGYRTHVIISKQGIPLVEKTLPNNIKDAQVAQLLIKKLKRYYCFKKGSVFIADTAYDERDFYDLIVNSMKSQAFIPLNPRNRKNNTLGPNGNPLCDAGFEMKSDGSWSIGRSLRSKFRCPIIIANRSSKLYGKTCPINHTRFCDEKAYGCTRYIDFSNDNRSKVPRDTLLFKKTYRKRQTVEQYFSRLGDREVEQTTLYKIKAVQNQMTIAHLSMSLVAAAAAILLKQPDKIRCYRTFANQPLTKVA